MRRCRRSSTAPGVLPDRSGRRFIRMPAGGYPVWQLAGSIALFAVVSVVAVVWRRRCPYLLVGWFWFLGMFLPVSGLLRIAEHARADRYSICPQIGLCIALCWGATRLAGASVDGRWALAGCAALVIATLIGCSIVQTTYWHDDLRLWTRSLAITGSNANAERGAGRCVESRQPTGRGH